MIYKCYHLAGINKYIRSALLIWGKGKMKKKILIGSIIAVVILVLVSFTGVVGYQTTKSSTIAKASPLFSVRTSRAVDKESKDIACDYVGKEKGVVIYLPTRPVKAELIDRFSIIFNRMDDKSFGMFVDLIIRHLHQKYDSQEYSEDKIVHTLFQMRGNPDYKNYYIVEEKSDPTILISMCNGWEPGCLFYRLLIELLYYYDCLIYKILELFLGVTFAYCNEQITLNN